MTRSRRHHPADDLQLDVAVVGLSEGENSAKYCTHYVSPVRPTFRFSGCRLENSSGVCRDEVSPKTMTKALKNYFGEQAVSARQYLNVPTVTKKKLPDWVGVWSCSRHVFCVDTPCESQPRCQHAQPDSRCPPRGVQPCCTDPVPSSTNAVLPRSAPGATVELWCCQRPTPCHAKGGLEDASELPHHQLFGETLIE